MKFQQKCPFSFWKNFTFFEPRAGHQLGPFPACLYSYYVFLLFQTFNLITQAGDSYYSAELLGLYKFRLVKMNSLLQVSEVIVDTTQSDVLVEFAYEDDFIRVLTVQDYIYLQSECLFPSKNFL